MENNALTIQTLKGAQLSIGKMDKGFINVFCNFNPIRRIRLMQKLNQTADFEIISIMNYQNGTGGFALKVSFGIDYATVISQLETIFKTEVE